MNILETINNFNNIDGLNLFTFGIVYLAGILTSFTPCTYPLIPIVIGVVGAKPDKKIYYNLFLMFLYTIGLALVYTILGLIAALSGKFFGQVQTSFWPNFILGNIMIFMGLTQFNVIHIPGFNSGLQSKIHSKGFLRAFFLGIASGTIAAPCSTPILAVILGFVALHGHGNLIGGSALLFVYAIGMGTLPIIVGSFLGLAKNISKLNKYLPKIQTAFGFILIFLGEYFIFKSGQFS